MEGIICLTYYIKHTHTYQTTAHILLSKIHMYCIFIFFAYVPMYSPISFNYLKDFIDLKKNTHNILEDLINRNPHTLRKQELVRKKLKKVLF